METNIMKNYFDESIGHFYKFYGYAAITEDQLHVVQIGQSIMMHRDGILNGGGFVTAFANNDLNGAVNRADKTVINHFPFFANLLQHCYVNC